MLVAGKGHDGDRQRLEVLDELRRDLDRSVPFYIAMQIEELGFDDAIGRAVVMEREVVAEERAVLVEQAPTADRAVLHCLCRERRERAAGLLDRAGPLREDREVHRLEGRPDLSYCRMKGRVQLPDLRSLTLAHE